MMAVDLHRGGELLRSSDQFQLADINNDGVSFSEDLGFDPQKPWLHNFDELQNNGFSSPVSSSPESETDQKDDYCIAELTRDQMAHYLFDPDDGKRCRFPVINNNPENLNETRDFGLGSQTSRLWSPFGSSYGSPEGPSLEPTPPATPVIEKRQFPWDYSSFEITTKLEEMNINNNEGSKYSPSNQNQSSLPTKPNSNPILLENPSSGFRQNQALTLDQIRAIQFYKLKQELILKQQSSANRVVMNQKLETHDQNQHIQFVKKERQSSNRQPWISVNQKQQKGSGMRAVFLGGSGSASGSCGTGVFLPCVIGETSQSRKKKGCSPVLIPAKVIQALKVHFDRMDNLSRHNATDFFPMQHDTNNNSGRNNGIYSQKKGQSRAAPAMTQKEMGLPQDWTY